MIQSAGRISVLAFQVALAVHDVNEDCPDEN